MIKIIGGVAGENRGIGAGTAIDGVVSTATGQRIVAGSTAEIIRDRVADQRVVARATDGIVDVGSRIIIVQIGVVDISRRVVLPFPR